MRLFHFSEESDIDVFEPQPVNIPSTRAPGSEWLNGPLVWAIDEWHQPMYLFPRDCPRILIWPVPSTTPNDLRIYWGASSHRMIASIEWSWLEKLSGVVLYRYELPVNSFESLDDAGMWVSRTSVKPINVEQINDIRSALRACEVELRIMPSLSPLKDLWTTSMHVSGIRLRNTSE